jgi:toxin secretion/phage lysis holin
MKKERYSTLENITQEIQFTHRYWILLLPLVLMTADIITGWIQATINNVWDSTKMRTGLFRKSGEMLVIVVAYVISVAIALPVDIPAWIAIYISIMEIISVCENLDQAGIPMPVWITRKLKKVAEDLSNGDDEEDPDAKYWDDDDEEESK